MSISETLMGINSAALDTPLNHLIWLNDYKTFGQDSYVYRNKDILHELYNSVVISANDETIREEAFDAIVTNGYPTIGTFFGAINDIRQQNYDVDWSNLTTFDAVVSSDVAMSAIVASDVVISFLAASETAKTFLAASETAMTFLATNETAMNGIFGVSLQVKTLNKSVDDNVVLPIKENVIYFVHKLYTYDSHPSDSGGSGTAYIKLDDLDYSDGYPIRGTGTDTTTILINKLCQKLSYKSNISGNYTNECSQNIYYYELVSSS